MSVWRKTPTLAGRRVVLRPFNSTDMDALIAVAREGDLWDLFYSNVSGLKTPDRWLADVTEQQSAGRVVPFTVLDASGTIVGATRFKRMAEAHRRLEIGGTFYALRVQRTGVNTEAKRLLLAHAFDALGCQCVQLRTDLLNRRSQAAIERLGARRDGVLRGHEVQVDGRLRDSVVYSILDREWPGVRANLDYLLGRQR